MLTAAEMRVVLFDLAAGCAAHQRRILVLAAAHQPDVVALQGDHLVRGEAPSHGSMGLPLNQPAVLDFLIELLLNPPKRGLAHCPLQRIPHQLTFPRNGFAFKVLFDRIVDGLPDCSVYLRLASRLYLVSAGLGFLHDTLRLVPEFLGHRLVTALHFFVADIDLGVPRSVGGDFCGFRPSDTLLVHVLFDLLPAWAARFQILLGVALDLRCSVWALLNFISQLPQAQRQFCSINGSRILLRAIQLMRLQCAGIAVFSLGDIEDDHMGMKLRGGISVHRTATVMLKLRGNPSAGCFGLMVNEANSSNTNHTGRDRRLPWFINRRIIMSSHMLMSPCVCALASGMLVRKAQPWGTSSAHLAMVSILRDGVLAGSNWRLSATMLREASTPPRCGPASS